MPGGHVPEAGAGGGAAPGAGAAGPSGSASWAFWPSLPGGFLIFFSVLIHFKLFRHFIKMCLLHHNYPYNIWKPPNIFVSISENFYYRH